jgi:Heterokaryon incompatibility protein (HET)
MSALLPRRSRSVDSALPAKGPTAEPEDSSTKKNASYVIPYQLELFGTGAYLGVKDLSPRPTPTTIHDYTYINRQTSIDRHHIRLIRLYPAVSRNAPLVCDLRVVSLDENPEYTALSYCWGDPIFDHEIICEGKTFLVTAQLGAALRQIWLLEPDQRPLWQPLWVDQICIYSHRTAMKHLETMKFASQFFEGFNFTPLASQIW